MLRRALRLRPILLISALIGVGTAARATETDQFTTPPRPLYDIGHDLSRKVVAMIESDHTGDEPELILHKLVGNNFLESRLTSWVKGIRPEEGAVEYHPSVLNSIYHWTFSPIPASLAYVSPTVRIHGYYMGTDKIDHFFQQGYEYYKRVERKQASGSDRATAIAKAVARGVKQEHTYFGTLASGIYSNADLAANYAGMKFYLNLRQPVRIGDRLLPPLFERSGNGWKLRAGVDPHLLLEPFLSDHLDESLNPSRYRFNRGSIRQLVRNRCEEWTRFYADRLDRVAPSGKSFATTWFGEDYGHWLPKHDEVSIATECHAGRLVSEVRAH